MFKYLLSTAVIITAVSSQAMNSWNHPLFAAMRQVESFDGRTPVGDKGRSRGVYHIQACYIKDVNRVYGTRFKLDDRDDPVKAHRIVRLYLSHYGRVYTRVTGKPATCEVLARIHNGGPQGWRKKATVKHWRRVERAMRTIIDTRKGGVR
jgi:hypothetical protein